MYLGGDRHRGEAVKETGRITPQNRRDRKDPEEVRGHDGEGKEGRNKEGRREGVELWDVIRLQVSPPDLKMVKMSKQ